MSKKSRNVQIYTDGYLLKTKALSWLENEIEDIHIRRKITKYLDKWIKLLVQAASCSYKEYGHESFLMMYRYKSANMWLVLPKKVATNIDNHINACRKHVFCG